MNQSGYFARISSKLLISLILVNCSTTQNNRNSRSAPHKTVSKTNNSTPYKKRESTSIATVNGRSEREANEIDIDSLYRRFMTPNYQISARDLSDMTLIGKPSSDASLKAAILTLGYTKQFIAEFEAAPLSNQASLSAHLRRHNISLSRTFLINPYLQHHQPFSLLFQALRLSNEPGSTKTDLIAYARRNLEKWQSIKLAANGQEHSDASSLSVSSNLDPSQYHAGDLLLGDLILLQAQKLAEKGRYKSAIGRAAKVPNSDPFFPAAQEKVKYFSNQAVQELRQKAATAFQNSLPVADKSARMAYLEEAKKYLEEALSEFPEADHLSTVRENLAVITRDLTSIDKESTQ